MIVNLVMLIQVVSALVIVGLVLMQHGKGADMGAAFGSGASGSLFGASGSSNFLSKSTGVAAAIFFASTLALAYLGSAQRTVSGGALDALPVTAPATAPASAPATVPAASAPASAPAPSVATPPAAAPAATAPASTPAAAKPASSQK